MKPIFYVLLTLGVLISCSDDKGQQSARKANTTYTTKNGESSSNSSSKPVKTDDLSENTSSVPTGEPKPPAVPSVPDKAPDNEREHDK